MSQTDFNDAHAQFGLDAVRDCIAAARPPDDDDATEAGNPASEPALAADNAPQSCSYGGGRFETSDRGVFFIGTDKDGNEKHPVWVCSPIRVVAMTRDAKSGEWGRLLEWHDADGVRHQWAMPLELTQGDGSDVRRELARFGVQISPARYARDLLASYIQVMPVDKRARCVTRLGWYGGVYVTPSESIGQHEEIVVFQNAHAIEPAFSSSGSVDDWRDTVGRLAAGNSRLVFSLSIAFAGALADVAGEDSGGFHLRGKSSSGKSTALKVAASAWGNPDGYVRLWRSTLNGLEGLAALHNHGLLVLDELSQMEPSEAGGGAYLLANGQAKHRLSRTGTARQAASWCLLFLSAGEESLSAMMARAGKKPNAGQEIRLADIEADAGAGMGAFETLHEAASPAALALAIKDAAAKFHGAVGIQWLRHIVEDRQKLGEFVSNGIKQFVEEFAPPDASGQVIRVARRFGLVAVAGELATHYGLTGWDEGEAIGSASKCFSAWLDAFGGSGNREDRALFSQVKAFFEAHGSSRFEEYYSYREKDYRPIVNRAGFRKQGDDGRTAFFVLPEAFKEICKGFDPREAAKVLVNAGWIEPDSSGEFKQKPRLPDMGLTRCYVFTGQIWEE